MNRMALMLIELGIIADPRVVIHAPLELPPLPPLPPLPVGPVELTFESTVDVRAVASWLKPAREHRRPLKERKARNRKKRQRRLR